MTQVAAWCGCILFSLLSGCVDAPEPVTTDSPASPVLSDSVDPIPTDTTTIELGPVAGLVPTPMESTPIEASESKSVPDENGWVASPKPLVEPKAASSLASDVPTVQPADAEPTPLDPVPTPVAVAEVPSLTPSGLTSVASEPEPAVNQQASSERPASGLPPSSAADAAHLAPVQIQSPDANPEAATAPASLASLDQRIMRPTLPTPTTADSRIPVSPVSIGQSIPDVSEGFTALFNNKDLTGWKVYAGKSESWKFQDGAVSCVAPGGGWLQTLELYCDFELQFEYRLSAGGNSGVCLRFPGHGNPSLEGLEIQLLDDRADKYQSIQPQQATGSLYFVTAPRVRDAAHVAGEWNQCTLRCLGDQLLVTINNQLVNEIDLSQLTSSGSDKVKRTAALRSPMGSIALQSHSTRTDFRNVHIRDLTQALESGVRWLDLRVGAGDSVPAGAQVTVHYIGFLSTGKRFANRIEKGKPATVPLKDVILGWREGIPGMKVGGKRRLVVPAQMAYGAKGFKELVPPNSTLVYEIELTGFEKPAGEVPATAESGIVETKSTSVP